jgi:hypothetical protein
MADISPLNPLFIDRIDGCPTQDDELSFPLKSWLSVLADTINSSFEEVEFEFNQGIKVSQFTQAQITSLITTAQIGTIFYDTTNNVWVGLTNTGPVKFTTAAWP